MSRYLISSTLTYRVPTVEDALNLRAELEEIESGELTNFSYATKYLKAKGEIIEEWQLVKAKIDFTPEKEPDQQVEVEFKGEGYEF